VIRFAPRTAIVQAVESRNRRIICCWATMLTKVPWPKLEAIARAADCARNFSENMKNSLLALVITGLAFKQVETYDIDPVRGFTGRFISESAADQGMIGNSVDVVIHVEADLKKLATATP
jgi:hypothetical protein